MTYEFVIDGETFNGRTLTGSGRVQIYQPSKQRVIASFDPVTASLFSNRPSGAWAHIHQDISLSLLEKIQPLVADVCKQRILNRYR